MTDALCSVTGKDGLSKGEAKSLAKRQARRSGMNVTAYACRSCGHWHVGKRRC